VAAAILVIIAAGGTFVWWFLKDDAPAEVDISQAAAQVDDSPATTAAAAASAASAATTADATTGIDGTWSVDTSIGEFSYEDSTGTFVGFRIAEQLSGIGSTTAVGRTPDVTGTITIDGTTVTAVTIEADMTSITTNDNRRNDEVQEALETERYPSATFVLTEPIELGNIAEGETIDVQATGDLTIHGVTQTVTIPLQAQLVDDTIVVVGSLDLAFADYGVEVPTAPIVLSVDDHGALELQLFFTRS
jgi:polyisoprenoid-binding protein YceI